MGIIYPKDKNDKGKIKNTPIRTIDSDGNTGIGAVRKNLSRNFMKISKPGDSDNSWFKPQGKKMTFRKK